MRTLTREIKELGKRLVENNTYLSFAHHINKLKKKEKEKENALENFTL